MPKRRNQFALWLRNEAARVVIESISWGSAYRVAVGRPGPERAFENFDLLDVAAAVGVKQSDGDPSASSRLPTAADCFERLGRPFSAGTLVLSRRYCECAKREHRSMQRCVGTSVGKVARGQFRPPGRFSPSTIPGQIALALPRILAGNHHA